MQTSDSRKRQAERAEVEAGDVEAIVRVLAEHHPAGVVNSREGWAECECGERLAVALDSSGYSMDPDGERAAFDAHRANQLADLLARVAAREAAARDAGARRVLDAVETLPGPGNVGIKGWPERDQECYLLAHEEALSAARAAVSDLRTEPAPEAEVERLRAERDEWRVRHYRMRRMYRERYTEGLSTEDWHAKHCAAMQGVQAERARADQAEAARDRVATAVEALADEWGGYGHGEFCTHLESQLPCSVCDLLSRLRAVLAEHGRTEA